MKRDFDLIRKIMIEAQSIDPNQGYVRFEYEGEDQRAVLEHCALLVKADLLEGIIKESESGIIHNVEISRLTWVGHDFIDAATENAWKKAKSTILNGATGITFNLLQKWLEIEAGISKGAS